MWDLIHVLAQPHLYAVRRRGSEVDVAEIADIERRGARIVGSGRTSSSHLQLVDPHHFWHGGEIIEFPASVPDASGKDVTQTPPRVRAAGTPSQV